jgi:hypothetical protein
MNFISECTLVSRKLNDGEERREYIALSEVKRLFEKWVEEKCKEIHDKEYNVKSSAKKYSFGEVFSIVVINTQTAQNVIKGELLIQEAKHNKKVELFTEMMKEERQ